MPETVFDLEQSRAYWRHVPSGAGKQDTAALAAAKDEIVSDAWDRGFRDRFVNYPEEEQFLRMTARTSLAPTSWSRTWK